MFFSYSPSICCAIESFHTQSPSKYNFETLTDCDFLRIPYSIHIEIIAKHHELNILFRKFTELLLIGMMERHHELMAFDSKTRFKNFISRSPHLLNMLSQKDIASYLRIDATNFSKLINTVKI